MARIVTKKEFLELPGNTLYRDYKPCLMGGLMIKGETIGSVDFWIQGLDDLPVDDAGEYAEVLESGKDFKFDYQIEGREGMFDDDQLYVVYDKSDVSELIERIQRCG